MPAHFNRRIGTAAVLSAMVALPAFAQDEAALPAVALDYEMPIYNAQWSSPQVAELAEMLSGSWASSQDVPVTGSEGESDSVGVVMNIAPAPIVGMSNTLYVESARIDSMHKPFRHAIFELFEYKGAVRMRTFEIAMSASQKEILTGIWAQPGFFPEITREDLIATMDVDLTQSGAGFNGQSPYAYPTGQGGAIEMTSRVELTADRFSSFNSGTDANGDTAWRANYTFIKGAPKADVSIGDNGLVIIEYANLGEIVVAEGDQLHIHYTGWTGDKNQFDASRPKGRPFLFTYPPGNRAIVGWGLGMDGISLGTHRRLIIPGYLAYGERGNPRAGIPGDATLYFEIECVHIDKPEAPSEAELDADAGQITPEPQVDPQADPEADPSGAGG